MKNSKWLLGVCVLAGACSSDPATNDAAATTDAVVSDVVSADAVSADAVSADVVSADAVSADVVSADAVSADVVSADVVSADVVSADASTGDAAMGDAGPDPYACLGMIPAPMATGTMSTLRARARNFANGAGMAGLTAKACGHADDTCATVLSMGTTDDMGYVTLTVPLSPTGFNGYIELTGGTGSGEVTPSRIFLNRPVTTTMAETGLLVIPRATFNALGGALGAMLDSTHGAITFGVAHCVGAAEGATVSATPALMGATAFYNVSGLPDPRAMATDATGQGGMLNVAPGTYTLTANRVTPAARIGSVEVSVRGGFVTAVTVVPSP
ncbi:MAG: hypothetical protein R3A48_13130 [Polyangiales bacterium]